MYSVKEIKKLIENGNKSKFYDDIYWKKLRNEILIRDNFECQECSKMGLLTIKQHKKKLDVHHKKELELYPELAYNKENLETVCVRHHNYLDNKTFDIRKDKFINEEKWE